MDTVHHRKAVKVLTKKLGRDPTEKEIAKKVNKLKAKAASKGGDGIEEEKKKRKKEKKKEKKKGKKRKADESDGEEEAPKELKKAKVAPNPDQVSKCFLGNLSYDIDDDQVKEYFHDCGGEITDIYWLTDKVTGNFKGCGFVTFSEPSVAAAAVAKAGEDLLGRPLKIDFAAPRSAGGGDQQAASKKHEPTPISAKPEGCLTVYCGNLSYSMDDDAAKAFFKDCGAIKKIRWLTDFATGNFKGCGFIDFYETESTDKAVALNGQQCLGRDVRLDYAVPTKKKEWDPSNPATPGKVQARVSLVKPPASAVEHCALCRKTFTSMAQKKEHEGGKWHKQRLSGELNPSNKPYNV